MKTNNPMSGRVGNWFLTSSGRQFWPFSPRVEDIDIDDIAQGLSNVCRFGGQCRTFYSVAQHSILVSWIVPPALALPGLLHDAPEAYIGDMVRPIKHEPAMEAFQRLEEGIWRCIARRFDLPYQLAPEIKAADDVALMTERRDLMAPSPIPWSVRAEPRSETIVAMGPRDARAAFAERYRELVYL